MSSFACAACRGAGVWEAARDDGVRYAGVPALGTVTDNVAEKACTFCPEHRLIRYEFAAGGVMYAGRRIRWRSAFAALAPGARVPVLYLPDTPDVSVIGAMQEWSALFQAVGAVSLIGATTFFLSLRGAPRYLRLLRRGVRTEARVSGLRRRAYRSVAFEVRYTYRHEDKFYLEMDVVRGVRPRRFRKRYAPGRKVRILYDPGNPRDSMLLR